jgi:hypothetical protein
LEVIAGRRIVAFRRHDTPATPAVNRFGFVQTDATKLRRRLCELMKSQGMPENQVVLFLSDGGETVRQLQAYLPPSSEHFIDCFPISMRLTVLPQQNTVFLAEHPEGGQQVVTPLERVKHYLWHGNVAKA